MPAEAAVPQALAKRWLGAPSLTLLALRRCAARISRRLTVMSSAPAARSALSSVKSATQSSGANRDSIHHVFVDECARPGAAPCIDPESWKFGTGLAADS